MKTRNSRNKERSWFSFREFRVFISAPSAFSFFAPRTHFIPIAVLSCLVIISGAAVLPGLPTVAGAVIGCGTAVFGASTDYVAGSSPRSVAVGDFNSDGRLDLAAANIGSNTVSMFRGNGNGGFAAAINFNVGSGPISVAVGDFNQDGKPDLATANVGANTVSILLGNGMGGFVGATNFGVGTFPFSIAVGDFNLDGNPDLVTANTVSANISVLLGDGLGGFATAMNIGVGSLPRSVAVGDLNHDDNPDLVVANQGVNNLSVLLGNGMGSFTAVTGPATGESPTSVVIGDLNLDGNQDLATANATANSVSVLLGNGMGGFGAASDFTLLNNPFSVLIGDFNLDGNPDLVTSNYGVTSVTALVGNGMGAFGGEVSFEVGTYPRFVATGDFNRDDTPDLVSANEGSNDVSVLLNTCINISPKVGHFPANGGVGSFMLTVSEDFAWTAESNVDWVTVNTPMGIGSATINFTLDPNADTARSGMIIISGQTYTVRQGANFADVSEANFFYDFIGKLSAAGVTTGCGTNEQGAPIYCPNETVTREQMAAFILRGLGEVTPPQPAEQRFEDVPPTNFFYPFIDRMAVLGITTGCNAPTFTQYCPGQTVTREQMAAFIIRALGEFNPPLPAMQRFEDVPPASFFYNFIDRMAVLGITTGCNAPTFTQYCPEQTVTREQMAAFLVRAFGL